MFSTLSTVQMVALYNQHADAPVSKFTTRAVAEKRLAALFAAKGIDPVGGDEAAPKQIDAERAAIEAEVRAECDAMHEEPAPSEPVGVEAAPLSVLLQISVDTADAHRLALQIARYSGRIVEIVGANGVEVVSSGSRKVAASKAPKAPRAPRAGGGAAETSAKAVELMQRPSGASLADLMRATGWVKKSVTNFGWTLRVKRGLPLEITKQDGGEMLFRLPA